MRFIDWIKQALRIKPIRPKYNPQSSVVDNDELVYMALNSLLKSQAYFKVGKFERAAEYYNMALLRLINNAPGALDDLDNVAGTELSQARELANMFLDKPDCWPNIPTAVMQKIFLTNLEAHNAPD